MGKDFGIISDNQLDTRSGVGGVGADHGGDLAKDTGVDLNKSTLYSYESGEYDYSDYQESGLNEPSADTGIDLNEHNDFTGQEYEMLSKDAGSDGAERMDAALENFQEDKWSDLSLEEQKQSIMGLADYVADATDNKNPPEIVFRDDMDEGAYGSYNPNTNTIEINQNMLGDSVEAADTITHEMWHAYQHQCALDPASEKGQAYQEGFDNYISPEYDFEGYENQMVEAEAREFAQGFRDRLSQMKGAA